MERQRNADGMPTERRRNADGTPTERRRNADGTPTERRQNADGMPTKSTADMDSWPNFKLFRPKLSQNRTKNGPSVLLYLFKWNTDGTPTECQQNALAFRL
jgi:hypothetical protein